MKLEKYNKDLNYSYTLGAFPTLELVNYKSEYVINIYIHSSFNNIDVINKIKSNIDESKIIYDDKVFNKLKDKDNTYIIGVFNKYSDEIDNLSNHVVLDNISNMGNLGTIIRSSLGFNINNIAIISRNIDIFDPKVIRASMGSIFSCKIKKYVGFAEYLENNEDRNLYPFMLKAKNKLEDIKFNNLKPSSLIFGNESSGLDEKIYSKYDSIVISHSNKIDSLNITNAVSIALYEFNKQIK